MNKLNNKQELTPFRGENIPKELIALPQWVAWTGIKDNRDKMSKIPINPSNGSHAKTNDSATWGTFDAASKWCLQNNLHGIGFVFSENDDFVGIDIDGCLSPETGKMDLTADETVKHFDSYTEISPSGKGLHIITKGKLPGPGRKNGILEMYDQKRFFTITGNLFSGMPAEISDCSDQIVSLYEHKFGKNSSLTNYDAGQSSEDRALIEKARNAENGDKFERLWNGNCFGYPSQSEADLALCKMLAFWANCDAGRMDRLFRASSLFRIKWDEIHHSNGKTYGRATIEKAIETTQRTFKSDQIAVSDQTTPRNFNLTDLGNAERLVYHFGDDIRYSHVWKKWVIWEGTRWSIDRSGKIKEMAKGVVRRIYEEAKHETDSDKRREVANHAIRSESERSIKAMASLSESSVSITPDQLDQNPWLLTCLNGTIDLKTGELLPHRKEHLITQLSQVEYDPEADCPVWREFLNRIMGGNENLISFLQKSIGYSLTGGTSEQCLFIFYGSGANGKSTFLQTINAMLGDYAKQTPTETLLVKQRGAIPNDVARLKGTRFVTASEAESGQRLAESLIKQMTGGDTISARFLHQEWFDFEPTHKIFLGTNHKPVIIGTDYAIWRRIRLVPFEVTIPEPERDKNLLAKLKDELSGILAWAVQGCLEWQEKGLGIPEEVKNATDDYRDEMDAIGDFLHECCRINPRNTVSSKELYSAYESWCEENGEQPLKQRTFGIRLRDKGFKPSRMGSTGSRGYEGIGLLTQWAN